MVESSSNSISRSDAAKVVRNRTHLHLAMRKAGYLMPSLSSPICTMKFMEKARKRIFFIPKKEEVGNVPECFSWPSKEVLLKKLKRNILQEKPQSELDRQNVELVSRTLAQMKKRLPDTKWLLLLCGIIIPDDEIFLKSYKW